MREWDFKQPDREPPAPVAPPPCPGRVSRVWELKSGVSIALGLAPSNITTNGFILLFPALMPRAGEEPRTFIFRPLDAGGREVGEEYRAEITGDQAEKALRGLA